MDKQWIPTRDIFKPFKVIISQFQLITLFLVILGFIIDLLHELIWYKKSIEWNVIFAFAITFSYSFIVYYLLNCIISRDYYDKIKSLSLVETYLLKIFEKLNFSLESLEKSKIQEIIKEIEYIVKRRKNKNLKELKER